MNIKPFIHITSKPKGGINILKSTDIVDNSFGMNTDITLRIHGENAKKAEKAVISVKCELARLERRLSRFVPDSEISKINRSAGEAPVEISNEIHELLAFALKISEISQGLFDVTVAPLVDLWDYKHSFHKPEEGKIRSTLSSVNFRELLLNSKEKTAGLSKTGQSIDLGGIGKGYASDRCIKLLRENGVSSAFINIGGNVSTLGNKPDGSPWSVGIRHPRQTDGLLGAVKVTAKAVVTSGDYERYFVDSEGKKRHHILNPVTGYPAESGLISASVVYDSAMAGDALSTAIFAGGIDKGMECLAQFPGAEAVFVDDHQRVHITRGIKESFQAADGIEASII